MTSVKAQSYAWMMVFMVSGLTHNKQLLVCIRWTV